MNYTPPAIDESKRLAALESYQIFDTESEKEFDDIASLASTVCNVPIALITFIDEDRQTFKAHYGTDLRENKREYSFCTHAIENNGEIMMINDTRKDDRFANNPVVTGPTKIAFYAGVPLVNEDGHALGTICVFDQQANDLSEIQINALKTLAKQVMDKLELRRKVKTLEEANKELLNSNLLIQKFASMAAHDIKNPLSNILLSSQALKVRHDKQQYDGCSRLIDLSISSSKSLLELVDKMLVYSKSPSSLLANKQSFTLNGLIKKITELLVIPENIEIRLPEKRHEICISLIAFDQIMLNLISNAIRYNDKENGLIVIRFKENDTFYEFEIEDNGIGISAEYYESIFLNNFTLGHTDRNNLKGTGIGLSTVKDLVTALNGTIHVESEVGSGSTFFLKIRK